MRQKYNKFVVEGDKIVREALRQKRFALSSVIATPDWYAEHEPQLRRLSQSVQVVTERDLKKVSALSTPNQALAVLDLPSAAPPDPLPPAGLVLYLDGIQQPSNFGAILRVADWFGVEKVICSPTTVDAFNPKSVQASMGAIFRVKLETAALEDWTTRWPNCPVFLADGRGEDIRTAALPKAGLLVLGAEGQGVSDEAHTLSQHLLAIPKGPAGGAESLNVAVAAGILVSYWPVPA